MEGAPRETSEPNCETEDSLTPQIAPAAALVGTEERRFKVEARAPPAAEEASSERSVCTEVTSHALPTGNAPCERGFSSSGSSSLARPSSLFLRSTDSGGAHPLLALAAPAGIQQRRASTSLRSRVILLEADEASLDGQGLGARPSSEAPPATLFATRFNSAGALSLPETPLVPGRAAHAVSLRRLSLSAGGGSRAATEAPSSVHLRKSSLPVIPSNRRRRNPSCVQGPPTGPPAPQTASGVKFGLKSKKVFRRRLSACAAAAVARSKALPLLPLLWPASLSAPAAADCQAAEKAAAASAGEWRSESAADQDDDAGHCQTRSSTRDLPRPEEVGAGGAANAPFLQAAASSPRGICLSEKASQGQGAAAVPTESRPLALSTPSGGGKTARRRKAEFFRWAPFLKVWTGSGGGRRSAKSSAASSTTTPAKGRAARAQGGGSGAGRALGEQGGIFVDAAFTSERGQGFASAPDEAGPPRLPSLRVVGGCVYAEAGGGASREKKKTLQLHSPQRKRDSAARKRNSSPHETAAPVLYKAAPCTPTDLAAATSLDLFLEAPSPTFSLHAAECECSECLHQRNSAGWPPQGLAEGLRGEKNKLASLATRAPTPSTPTTTAATSPLPTLTPARSPAAFVREHWSSLASTRSGGSSSQSDLEGFGALRRMERLGQGRDEAGGRAFQDLNTPATAEAKADASSCRCAADAGCKWLGLGARKGGALGGEVGWEPHTCGKAVVGIVETRGLPGEELSVCAVHAFAKQLPFGDAEAAETFPDALKEDRSLAAQEEGGGGAVCGAHSSCCSSTGCSLSEEAPLATSASGRRGGAADEEGVWESQLQRQPPVKGRGFIETEWTNVSQRECSGSSLLAPDESGVLPCLSDNSEVDEFLIPALRALRVEERERRKGEIQKTKKFPSEPFPDTTETGAAERRRSAEEDWEEATQGWTPLGEDFRVVFKTLVLRDGAGGVDLGALPAFQGKQTPL